MTHRSEYWEDRPDGFDHNSRELVCSISGIPFKGPVLRGPNILEEGYFDISMYAAEDLARHIGFVSPDEHADVSTRLAETQSQLHAYQTEAESLREQVRALTLANAELYSLFEDDASLFEDDEA